MQKCKKNLNPRIRIQIFVAPIGFEPIQTEPESAVLPLHNRANANARQKYTFFLTAHTFFEKKLLTYKNHFVPNISANYNCLIINVIHFIIERVVQDNFFVVAGEFRHARTDRRGYNLVIIVLGEVESAVIVVVVHIFVHHNYRAPGVEDGVGYDGSKGRTADDVATVDVAAVDAVVEVVGDAVIVDRSDVVRDVNVGVVVVVVGVHIRGVRRSAIVRTMISMFVIVVYIAVSLVTRTGHNGLRLSLTFGGITALCNGAGAVGGGRGACICAGSHILLDGRRAARILSCCCCGGSCSRCRDRTSVGSGGLVSRYRSCGAAGCSRRG